MSLDHAQEMPSGKKNCENLKLALKGDQMDASHIKKNLDLLNQEITKVGGDIARLGISLDDLKYIDKKLTAKAPIFGAEFPVQEAVALKEILEQAESRTEEQSQDNPEIALSGGETSPEYTLQNEITKINSAVDELNHWLEIFSGDLNSGGSTWSQVDRGLARHLKQLNDLKGSELVAKGKIPEKVEDKLIEALGRVRQLKIRHDRLQQPPTFPSQSAA